MISCFPGGSDGKESSCNAGDWLDPWVRKILWQREWQPTPVFLSGEFHGQRSLAGYGPWGCKESDTTEQLTFSLFTIFLACVLHKNRQWALICWTLLYALMLCKTLFANSATLGNAFQSLNVTSITINTMNDFSTTQSRARPFFLLSLIRYSF